MAANPLEGDNPEFTEINVTPLVDVTLVLLVIFMVTASLMLTRTLPVNLPPSSTGQAAGQTTWHVVVARRNEYQLNGKPVRAADLAAKLRLEVAVRPALRVDLAADEALAYRDVVAALDLLKGQGVRQVALAVAPR